MKKRTQDPQQPLRGDAAWRAMKGEIAKRNEAAQARGAAQRAAHDEETFARRRAAERLEAEHYPVQPTP